MPNNGLFIVLEGADGSGKGTQFKLLAERLSAVGYDVETFDFPRYDQPSSHFVRQYLNGIYGPAGQVNPYSASMFYALDRFEAAPDIKNALEAGKVVLSNRYAGSNMAHQGSKFSSEAQKRGFFMWADSLEFQLLNIPRPDLNIYLKVPAEISYRLIAKKAARSYTNKKRDEHEDDLGHLQEAVRTYDLLCKLFPRDYRAIDSTLQGKLMSIPEINNQIWQVIQPYLHERLVRVQPVAKTVLLGDSSASVASQTSPELDIKAMAPPKNASYKIDALSYLAVAELVAKTEARVKISDVQFAKPQSSYFRPPDIQPGIWRQYQSQAKSLETKRAVFLKQVKKVRVDSESVSWLTRTTLPLGALLKTQVSISDSDLGPLGLKLMSSKSLELKLLATQLNHAGTTPPLTQEMSKGWLSHLTGNFGSHDGHANMVAFWPKREFELLQTLAYGSTDMGISQLEKSLDNMEYAIKAKLLKSALSDSTAINGLPRQPWYEAEVLLSPAAALYLTEFNLVKIASSQMPDPRYGYEVPKILEKHGLDEQYIDLFDSSLQAYGSLQNSSQPEFASLIVLGGHLMRCLVRLTARQLYVLKKQTQLPVADELHRLADSLYQQASDAHPILWQALARSNPAAQPRSLHTNPAATRKTARRRRKR